MTINQSSALTGTPATTIASTRSSARRLPSATTTAISIQEPRRGGDVRRRRRSRRLAPWCSSGGVGGQLRVTRHRREPAILRALHRLSAAGLRPRFSRMPIEPRPTPMTAVMLRMIAAATAAAAALAATGGVAVASERVQPSAHPSHPARSDDVVIRFRTRETLDGAYHVEARHTRGQAGCQVQASRRVPAPRNGRMVRLRLRPPRVEGEPAARRWCDGAYRARVLFKQTVSCPPTIQCGDSVAVALGSTTFTVVASTRDRELGSSARLTTSRARPWTAAIVCPGFLLFEVVVSRPSRERRRAGSRGAPRRVSH